MARQVPGGLVCGVKTIEPAAVAVVLWLLFFVSNVFAVFKPPYPGRIFPPDQIVIITGTEGEKSIGTASEPK
jgi:hypothetical protein